MSWKRDNKITNLRTLHTERPTPVLLLSSGGQLLGPTPGFNNLTRCCVSWGAAGCAFMAGGAPSKSYH